jgi:hypothetical protein
MNKYIKFFSIVILSFALSAQAKSKRLIKRIEKSIKNADSRFDKIKKSTKNILSLCNTYSHKLSNGEMRELEQKIKNEVIYSSIAQNSFFDICYGMYTKFPLVACEEYLSKEINFCIKRKKKCDKLITQLTCDTAQTKNKESKEVRSKLDKFNLQIQELEKDLKKMRDTIMILPSFSNERTSREIYIRPKPNAVIIVSRI